MPRRMKSRNSSAAVAIMRGVVTSVLVMICAAMIVAYLIAAEYICEESVGYGSCIGLLASAFLGALVGSRGGEKHLLLSVATGFAYWAILLCATAVLFQGIYAGIGMTALLVLGSAGAAGLVGMGKGRTQGRRKIRI